MRPNHAQLRELLRALDATSDREIDCRQFLGRVAAYVESLGDDDLATLEPSDMTRHLRICPECLEEFEALLQSYRQS